MCWAASAEERTQFRKLVRSAILVVLGTTVVGCASVSGGPPRLYAIEEEIGFVRSSLGEMNIAEFSRMNEASRRQYRNAMISGRMYAIDIQYTAYESALTRERQNVGFGAAATTIGLATASTLVTPTATKDLLTGLAGFVTGARAAYDNDILFAHSVQWIQTQMRTQRSTVADRILRGMRASTEDYPMAAALSDLEDYYRAGTFTGGVIGTTATLGAEERLAQLLKQDRIEVAFVPTAAGRALRTCLRRPGVRQEDLVGLMAQPSSSGFALLLAGQSPEVAQAVLQKARNAGICP